MGLADLQDSSSSEGQFESDFWNFDKSEVTVLQQSTVSARSARRRTVSFGAVQVRVYQQILGENPACEAGPSLAIGWAFCEVTKKPLSVDKFEAKRRRKQRQGRPAQKLSQRQRARIAYRAGFTKKQIKENTILISKLNNQRNETLIDLYGLTSVTVDQISLLRLHAREESEQLEDPNSSSLRRWLKYRLSGDDKYRVMSSLIPIKIKSKPKGASGRAA